MPPRNDAAPPRREAALTVGIGALAIAAPLLIGSVHPPTQVALSTVALVLFAACAWMRGARGLRLVPFAGAMLLALAFTALQLVPLPAPIVALLSPAAYQLRSDVTPGRWLLPLTVDVPATLLALVRAAACTGVVLALGSFVRSRRHARRLLWALAAMGTLVAIIACTQRAFGSETILGFYRPRSTPGFGVFGTFVDVNHAASVLALGLLVASGLAVEHRDGRRALAVGCAALCGAALLLSTSRGGLVGAAVGALLLATLLFARGVGWTRGLLAAGVLMVAVVALSLWTSETLRERFLPTNQPAWSTQKTRGWSDGMRLAAAYRWTGVGRGAFEAPVNGYRLKSDGVRLVYPEDLFVELMSEWGAPMALALMVMVLVIGWRFAPSLTKLSAGSIGAFAGVVAVIVHEATDFGLETLGVALPTAVGLGIVVGEATVEARKQKRSDRAKRLQPRVIAAIAAAWALALVGSAWAARHTLDADWSRVTADRGHDDAALAAAIARHPADDYLELLAAQHDLQAGSPAAMRHINRALILNPSNWQGHRMAARLLASAHHPAQAALEYRLAIGNGFSADINELARVLGRAIVDAVPQQPAALFQLARDLYALKYRALGDAATLRAVDVADEREPVLAQRLEILAQSSTPDQVIVAGRALTAEATTTASFVLAARALAHAGDRAGADSAILAGQHAHPDDTSLVLVGAKLRSDAGDLDGARALLSRSARLALTLPERQQAEELLAEIADKQGDEEGAVRARARARLIAQRLRDMTPRAP